MAYRIVRAMFVVLFFWLFLKFGGFLLNALVGSLYGAGAESDAYFFATQTVVSTLIYAQALRILIPAFTPVFIDEKNRRGERAAWDFASSILNLMLVGCAVMMVLVYAYAEPLTATLVRGFGGEAQAITVKLIKWVMPGAALMMLYLPVRAILNSYKVFSYPAAAEAAQKLLWALGLFVTYRFLHLGIMAVAFGFLVGSAGMLAVSLFGARRHAGLYRVGFPSVTGGRLFKECLICAAFVVGTIALLAVLARLMPAGSKYRDLVLLTTSLFVVAVFIGQLWLRARKRVGAMAVFTALAAPLIISTVFAAYRDVITFYFQSFTARGVFSDIEYARRIALLPSSMVAYALSVAMLPYLCELASGQDRAELAKIVSKALRMLALAFVPLTVMTMVLADPLSRLVLDRGDWPDVHLHYTALALVLLTVGLLVYAWEYVINQAYFSIKDMWTPALLGIVATLFQFAFLAVPIYALGWDYPVQVFFLTALAYPISRYFKNLILLGLLARKLPVVPVRSTLIFTAKLAALTVVVGAATWGTYKVVRARLPYDDYRQYKVVIDNFETGPDTWFSLNAKEVEIVKAPGEDHGLAVMMRYDRHGSTPCSLYRKMTGMPTYWGPTVSFSLYSEQPMAGIAVDVEQEGKRQRVLDERFDSPEKQPVGRWREFSFSMNTHYGADASLHWSELPSSSDIPNTFYLDNIRLSWDTGTNPSCVEDFDSNGWEQGAEGGVRSPAHVVSTGSDGGIARLALQIPANTGVRCTRIASLDLGGTLGFRCRLFNRDRLPVAVKLSVVLDGETGVKEATIQPGSWETVGASWRELGFVSMDEFGPNGCVLVVAPCSGELFLDDLTCRMPASRMYEVMKFVHCVVPTLAALLAALICLVVLRFEEVRDVVAWVKARGWRQRKEAVSNQQSADS